MDFGLKSQNNLASGKINPFPTLTYLSNGQSFCSLNGFLHNNSMRSGADEKNPTTGGVDLRNHQNKELCEVQQTSKHLKSRWTPEEDKLLIGAVEKFGACNWSKIAKEIEGKGGKQCGERWKNYLDPNLKKGKWTKMEVEAIFQAQKDHGNKWSKIAREFRRSENSIKNLWNASQRKIYRRSNQQSMMLAKPSILPNNIKKVDPLTNEDYGRTKNVASINMSSNSYDIPNDNKEVDHSTIEGFARIEDVANNGMPSITFPNNIDDVNPLTVEDYMRDGNITDIGMASGAYGGYYVGDEYVPNIYMSSFEYDFSY